MGSASDFGKDLGLVHEAVVTGRKAGWGQKEWAQLAHDEEMMRRILSVLRGQAEITAIKYVVDCSALPPPIDGLTPLPADEQIASRFQGQFELTPEALALHLDPGQQDGKVMTGNALRTSLSGVRVLTADVLDAYLAHPELIPESLKKDADGNTIYTFFWGTIYRDSHGNLYVRCLCWYGDRWYWSYCWLEADWRSGHPSAVPASI